MDVKSIAKATVATSIVKEASIIRRSVKKKFIFEERNVCTIVIILSFNTFLITLFVNYVHIVDVKECYSTT